MLDNLYSEPEYLWEEEYTACMELASLHSRFKQNNLIHIWRKGFQYRMSICVYKPGAFYMLQKY